MPFYHTVKYSGYTIIRHPFKSNSKFGIITIYVRVNEVFIFSTFKFIAPLFEF